MSFTWFADKPLRTEEEVARAVHVVSLSRGLDELASVLALMAIRQESNFWCPANDADPTSKNYPYDSMSDDGRSVAYLQQQNAAPGEVPAPDDDWWGPMSCRMSLSCSVNSFLARLSDDYTSVTTAAEATEFIANVQNCREDLRDAYAQHWDYCHDLLTRALADGPVTPSTLTTGVDVSAPAEPTFRPDFNEFALASPNYQERAGTPVDLFLLHTQEGGGGDDAALHLAQFLADPASQVSYNYVISLASDGGITVIDCVPIDRASWSVLDANNRSIDLCFAGSYAAWTREEWIANAGRAIDVAAYIAARDCIAVGIPTRTIFPPYAHPGGVSDHRYVTEFLGIGTHVDVGGPMGPPWTGFPWDSFDASFQKYAGLFAAPAAPAEDGTPPAAPAGPPPGDPALAAEPTDAEYEVLAQTRGRWGRLGKNKTGPSAGKNRTLVEAVGFLVDEAEHTDNSANTEFSW